MIKPGGQAGAARACICFNVSCCEIAYQFVWFISVSRLIHSFKRSRHLDRGSPGPPPAYPKGSLGIWGVQVRSTRFIVARLRDIRDARLVHRSGIEPEYSHQAGAERYHCINGVATRPCSLNRSLLVSALAFECPAMFETKNQRETEDLPPMCSSFVGSDCRCSLISYVSEVAFQVQLYWIRGLQVLQKYP